jgi:hypothetical protein
MSPIANTTPARCRVSSIFRAMLVLAGLAATSVQSQAAFITKFDGIHAGHSPAGQYSWHQSQTNYDAAVSQYGVDYIHTTSGSGANTKYHFITFCIQKNVYMTSNPHSFEVVDLTSAPEPGMSPQTALDIRTLWGNFFSRALGTNTLGNDAAKSAAFGYAIWHLLGQFDPGSTGAGLANGVLTNYLYFIDSDNWDKKLVANLRVLSSPNDQDQLIEVRGGDGKTTNTVPAPAALVLALTGLGPCLLLRRRIFSRKVA